jgi:hypothetical protein
MYISTSLFALHATCKLPSCDPGSVEDASDAGIVCLAQACDRPSRPARATRPAMAPKKKGPLALMWAQKDRPGPRTPIDLDPDSPRPCK